PHCLACGLSPDSGIDKPWMPAAEQHFSGLIGITTEVLEDFHGADKTVKQSTEQSRRREFEVAPKHLLASYLVAKVVKPKRDDAVDKIRLVGEVGGNAVDNNGTVNPYHELFALSIELSLGISCSGIQRT